MNVIYIHSHDTGRYIKPYGHQVPTENLMSLARQGTLFRHAYSAAPTCSPSRAGLLTGMAPHSCGMLGLAHRGFRLHNYEQHMVQFLNEQGYQTVLCGEQHEAPFTEMIGYQSILDMDNPKIGPDLRQSAEQERDTWQRDLDNAHKTAEFLHSRNSEQPFFLSFGMVNTHRDFPQLDGSVNPDYIQPPSPLADTKENREDMATYIMSAKVMDECVGIVLKALQESGLEDDTFLFFTTDHGIAFPKMKSTLYDTGIGVSLIIKYPENPLEGKAVDSLVSHLDLFPTICDLLQLPQPEWLQGVSLRPVLEGNVTEVRSMVHAEVSWHAAFEPMRCVRTKRYKLIKSFDPNLAVVLANVDDSLAKDFLLANGFADQSRDSIMLFDLYHDPGERVNVANNQEYQQIRQELEDSLDTWMRDTLDPLVAGRLQPPPGAIVNKRRCISPEEEDFE